MTVLFGRSHRSSVCVFFFIFFGWYRANSQLRLFYPLVFHPVCPSLNRFLCGFLRKWRLLPDTACKLRVILRSSALRGTRCCVCIHVRGMYRAASLLNGYKSTKRKLETCFMLRKQKCSTNSSTLRLRALCFRLKRKTSRASKFGAVLGVTPPMYVRHRNSAAPIFGSI